MSGGVIVFSADVGGMLGAAALVRRLGPDLDLLAVAPREIAAAVRPLGRAPAATGPRGRRRPDRLAGHPLVPALHRFVAAGTLLTWVCGRGGPPDLLRGLGDLIPALRTAVEIGVVPSAG